MTSSHLFGFSLALLFSPLTAGWDLFDEQYIRFNGGVSATTSWIPPPGASDFKDCNGIKTAEYSGSRLMVGIDPPWDPNPLYFYVRHIASNCNDKRKRDSHSARQLGCLTSDNVRNWHFSSASSLCYTRDKNERCGTYESLSNTYDRTFQHIDLKNKARIQRVDVGSAKGYRVEGSHESWIKDDSRVNWVDVTDHCRWNATAPTPPNTGDFWYRHNWNGTDPMEFSLTFSNNTAELVVTTNKTYNGNTYATMTLRFKGEREDPRQDPPPVGEQPPARVRYPIQLNTNDANLPRFEFLNGSSVYFANISGTWVAAGAPISDPTTTTSTTSSKNAAPTRAIGNLFSMDVMVVVTVVVALMMN